MGRTRDQRRPYAAQPGKEDKYSNKQKQIFSHKIKTHTTEPGRWSKDQSMEGTTGTQDQTHTTEPERWSKDQSMEGTTGTRLL